MSQISNSERLSFAILICKRLITDYQRFVINRNWGDIFVLNQALDYCTRVEKGIEFDSTKIDNLIIAVDNITPDTDEFKGISGLLAMNSATVITETLNFILDKSEQRIVDIGLLAYSSTYFKTSDAFPNLDESRIEKTKEIVEEINWQLKQTIYL